MLWKKRGLTREEIAVKEAREKSLANMYDRVTKQIIKLQEARTHWAEDYCPYEIGNVLRCSLPKYQDRWCKIEKICWTWELIGRDSWGVTAVLLNQDMCDSDQRIYWTELDEISVTTPRNALTAPVGISVSPHD